VNAAIETVRKEKNIGAVLRSEEVVSGGININDDVIAELKRMYKK
jgi:hypothetical protein